MGNYHHILRLLKFSSAKTSLESALSKLSTDELIALNEALRFVERESYSEGYNGGYENGKFDGECEDW